MAVKKDNFSKYTITDKNNLISDSGDFNCSIYNRTSAQNVLGTFSLDNSIDKVTFETAMYELYKYTSNVNINNRINVYCFVNKVEGYEKGWYLLKENTISNINVEKESNMLNFLHDSHEFFSISTMPVVLFFACDIDEYYDKYGLNAIKTFYINTGEVCQGASIAFSKYGYFTRPLKNLNERYVEESLGLPESERITYMLVIGKNNISSLMLEVV